MNLIVENNRASTCSKYDIRIVRVLTKLEGAKRWKKYRTLSFDASTYNLELWRATWPDAEISTPEGQPYAPGRPVSGNLASPEPRMRFKFSTLPRAHQRAALANPTICC